MAKINIRFSEVHHANEQLDRVLRRLGDAENTVYYVQKALDADVKSRHDINEKLTLCRRHLSAMVRKTTKLKKTVNSGVMQYIETERRNNMMTDF